MRSSKLALALALIAVGIGLMRLNVFSRVFSSSSRPLSLKSALDPQKGLLLGPLLAPRVPGTAGHVNARNHIVSKLESFGWVVELDKFSADTPLGPVPMANILAYRPGADASNPRPRSTYTLSAHYDSKRTPEGFIGAIDSAFPCALLLYLAALSENKTPDYPFDLIFFDGEEAMVEWSDTDSLYGSRHLATSMAENKTLPNTLVLLDLIGCENWMPIPSWFDKTYKLHSKLSKLNPRIVGGRPIHEYGGYMMDDHIPFLQYDVPVLHLIPPRFPDIWHTLEDDAENLHWPTMVQWTELMQSWLFESEQIPTVERK